MYVVAVTIELKYRISGGKAVTPYVKLVVEGRLTLAMVVAHV